MSMLRKGDAATITKFCEFVINRCGLGRGGEHLFLRWNMGHWDFYFNGADLEWTMMKTITSQCMLFFCDRSLYCLCPYFAWGCYFMYNGLDKAGIDPEIKDFVFPNLHSMKREGVSRRLTTSIRDNIDVSGLSKDEAKKRKDCYSSRSMRVGAMTQNRANPDLSLEEEYERSGHKMDDLGTNPHAEGYVGSTPAVNAPGGLALAGHKNCHVIPYAFSWSAVSHAMVSANNLIDHMFVNDVPQLKSGGNLEMLPITAAARLVASYNQLLMDLGKENPIVVKLELAAKKANIKDPKVSLRGGHEHLQVLQSWSTLILDDYETKNNERLVSHDGKVNSLLESLVDRFSDVSSRLVRIEDSMHEVASTKQLYHKLAEQQEEIGQLKKDLIETTCKKEIYKSRLKTVQALKTSMNLTPEKPRTQSATSPQQVQPPSVSAKAASTTIRTMVDPSLALENLYSSNKRWSPPLHVDSDNVEIGAGKREKKADSGGASKRLKLSVPVENELKKSNAGYTIDGELVRLYNEGRFSPSNNRGVDKTMLFDETHPNYVGQPVRFKDKNRYTDAMKFVSMGMDSTCFQQYVNGELDERHVREVAKTVAKDTLHKILSLEFQYNIRESMDNDKSQAKMNAVGTRYTKLFSAMVEMLGSKNKADKMMNEKMGMQPKKQAALTDMFGKRTDK